MSDNLMLQDFKDGKCIVDYVLSRLSSGKAYPRFTTDHEVLYQLTIPELYIIVPRFMTEPDASYLCTVIGHKCEIVLLERLVDKWKILRIRG